MVGRTEMMKKLAGIFLVFMMIYPSPARADLDLLSLIQDELASLKEKVNMVLKEYVNIEAQLQELSSGRGAINILRDKYAGRLMEKYQNYVDKFKQYTSKDGWRQATDEFLSSRNVSLTLSGTKVKADTGPFVSPELKKAVAQKYIKRQHVNEDVETMAKIEEQNNEMARQNMSSLYANALVNRVNLADEAKDIEKDEAETSEDAGVVKQRYATQSLGAAHRWLNIMSALAMYQQQIETTGISHGRVEEISDITGEEEDPELNNMLIAEERTTKINISDLYKKGKQMYDSGKNKDFGEMLNTATNIFDDVEQSGPSQEDYLRAAGLLDN